MSWFREFRKTTVGKKIFVAITGIFLITFLVVHLAGNLLLFKGQAEFNEYSRFMSTSPLIRVMEIILAVGFLVHIFYALFLTYKNRKSRPRPYAVKDPSSATFSSRTMPFTGALVLIYLVIHINSFTVKHRVFERENTDFYRTVVESFQFGWGGYYWLFYVFSMIILAIHLNHGFQSAFQTLGLRHKKYTPLIEKLGTLIAIAIPAGFASIPIYFYFFAPKI